jgi:tripartite-type tricarboxylate transporter receptor subunit TctC
MSVRRAQGLSAFAFVSAFVFAFAPAVQAQSYPSRSIRIVVPFTPAGPTDFNARMIAQKLLEAWGQPVIVENRPAAGGVPGTDIVAKANPDGYTLLGANTGPLAIAPGLYSKLPYDALKNFVPVIMTTQTMGVFAVHPNLPAKSIQELIALAKTNPGKYTFGSTGIGTVSHLSFELFVSMAGIKMIHVPYKGTAQATNDFLAGQIDMRTLSTPVALPLMRLAKVRVLSVNGTARSLLMPEIPTVAESGLPGFATNSWNGLMAPAGTPRDIVMKLHAEIRNRMLTGEQREQLIRDGYEISGLGPQEFSAFLKAEIDKWGRIVRIAGVKPE